MPFTPDNNPGEGSSNMQYFAIDTLTQTITWKHGDPLPPNVKINVTCIYSNNNDVLQKMRVRMNSNTNGSQLDTVDFSDGQNIIEYFDSSSTVFDTSVYAVFKNFEQLQEGTYITELFFDLSTFIGGTEFSADSLSLTMQLIIQGSGDIITTDKAVYNVVFNRQDNSLSGDLEVNILGNNGNSELMFFNNLNIFNNVSSIINNNFLLEPSTPLSTNPNLPAQGLFEISSLIKKKIVGGNSQNVYSFLINLFVLNGDLLVTPDFLSFSLLQSASEVKSSKIRIINPYNKSFMVEAPYWLELSANSGNDDMEITVSTLNSAIIPIGDYTGNIILKFDAKETKIPVSVSVISFVYLTGMEDYNFCLDNKIINFIRRTTTARYVRSTLTITFKNEDETKIIQRSLVVPYYNEKASFDLGEKIHQYFVRLKKSILKEQKLPSRLDNKLWMYPAEVKILVEELDVDYNVVHSENVSAIYFYPGKKPAAFPLLSNNLYRQRIEGSKYIFTYIQGLVNPSKIGSGTPNILENGIITRLKIEDDEDKIFFPKKKIIEITPEKSLIYISPLISAPQVINIQFENQNLCPESFTFTGHIKKNQDFTHIYDQNVITSLREKYDTTKLQTWVINTGFVIKKCIPTILEIIDSKLCFIEYEGKVFRGFCVSQKLVSEDTSLELIQFDLDFLIFE
ncbi:hypothetical protein ACVVIH_06810 [Chryseobacterium arthrosphaerae]